MLLPQSRKHLKRISSEAKSRRDELLAAVGESFTPAEAMVAWDMTRTQVGNMTNVMRAKSEISSGGTSNNRIFSKVKQNANQIS